MGTRKWGSICKAADGRLFCPPLDADDVLLQRIKYEFLFYSLFGNTLYQWISNILNVDFPLNYIVYRTTVLRMHGIA